LLARTPRSTPFPYTTLFRSLGAEGYAESGATQHRKIVGSVTDCNHLFHAQVLGFGDLLEVMCFPCAIYDLGCHFARDGSIFHFRSEEHTSELQSRENLVCRL